VNVPAAAKAHTEEGAKAFAEFFVDTLNESQVTPDSAALDAISDPSCKGCNVYIKSANAMRSKKQRADGPSMRLKGILVRPDSTKALFNLDLLIDELASKTVDQDGKVIESYDAGKLTLRTTLRPTTNGWAVKQALLVS
jgi:hypothetical protein